MRTSDEVACTEERTLLVAVDADSALMRNEAGNRGVGSTC
jgi:hypothetical protein